MPRFFFLLGWGGVRDGGEGFFKKNFSRSQCVLIKFQMGSQHIPNFYITCYNKKKHLLAKYCVCICIMNHYQINYPIKDISNVIRI